MPKLNAAGFKAKQKQRQQGAEANLLQNQTHVIMNQASLTLWKGNDEVFKQLAYDMSESASSLKSNDDDADIEKNLGNIQAFADDLRSPDGKAHYAAYKQAVLDSGIQRGGFFRHDARPGYGVRAGTESRRDGSHLSGGFSDKSSREKGGKEKSPKGERG